LWQAAQDAAFDAASPRLIQEGVSQNAKYPRTQIGAGFPGRFVFQRSKQGFLHQIVSPRGVAREEPRKSPHLRHQRADRRPKFARIGLAERFHTLLVREAFMRVIIRHKQQVPR